MQISWNDLTRNTKQRVLNDYATRHAEWNYLTVKQAKSRLLSVLKKTDGLFSIPLISYEATK